MSVMNNDHGLQHQYDLLWKDRNSTTNDEANCAAPFNYEAQQPRFYTMRLAALFPMTIIPSKLSGSIILELNLRPN
jgi:hypothetical protein